MDGWGGGSLGGTRNIPRGGRWPVRGLTARPGCRGHERNPVCQEGQGARDKRFLRGEILFIDTARNPSADALKAPGAFSETRDTWEGRVVDSQVMEASITVSEFVVIQSNVDVVGYHVIDRFNRPSEGGVKWVCEPT